MVSVTDLCDYLWCTRCLWLKKRLGIKPPTTTQLARGSNFHLLVHGIYEQIKRSLAADIPGKVIATELILPKKAQPHDVLDLVGRLDVLRQATDGYIVQDEKYTAPPEAERIYPSHKLQLDAYAFLVEKEGYVPVKAAIIIYEDLKPREVAPDPERIPEFIANVKQVLKNEILPEVGEKCGYCSLSPLCAILPQEGGLTVDQIMRLKKEPVPRAGYIVLASFPSRSRPNVVYTVMRSKDGAIRCDCPGWKTYRKCWHVEKAAGSS